MDTGKIEVLSFDGSPKERGRQHGEHLRERIHNLLEKWGDALEVNYGVDREYYLSYFKNKTCYEQTTARLAPLVLEEVRGIADGSNSNFMQVLAFQHLNEEFALGPRVANIQRAQREACSTIVVSPDGERPSLVAQNLDLAEFLDGFQTLFQYPCSLSDGQIIALSVPGMISLNGMNSHGVAICDNTLGQLKADPAGLPVYAIYRMLLESHSLAQACQYVVATPHAASLNWVMGDPDGVAMIERSGGKAEHYFRPSTKVPVFHTNHPLVNDEWTDIDRMPSRSSYLRYASLHERLFSEGQNLTVDDLKAVLSSQDDPDYPVSRGGAGLEDRHIGFTFASSVFELYEDNPVWHLAAGPPHKEDFRTFSFS